MKNIVEGNGCVFRFRRFNIILRQYGPDGEIPKELQNLNFYNNGTEDVVDSFNAGRFYVLHRDHGAVDVYGDPSMMIRTEVPWAYCSSDYHEDSNGLFVYFDEPVYIAVKDVITGKSKIHYGKHFPTLTADLRKKNVCIYGPNSIPYKTEIGWQLPGVNNGDGVSLNVVNNNSTNRLSVAYELPETSERAELQINNILTGAPMVTRSISAADNSVELDTSLFDSGYYVVGVTTEDGQTAQGRFAVVR